MFKCRCVVGTEESQTTEGRVHDDRGGRTIRELECIITINWTEHTLNMHQHLEGQREQKGEYSSGIVIKWM